MINFTSIRNKELVRLMLSSYKFMSLPEKNQWEHISRISKLSEKEQEKVAKFFKKQNAEETKQKIAKLQKATEELTKLGKDFIKESKKDAAKMKKVLAKTK